jgi:hypothetical protein
MAPQTGISAELAASPTAENAIALHPTALMRYEGQLERLQETLEAGVAAGDTAAGAAIRDLDESLIVNRDRYGGVEVEIHGRLSALLGAGTYADAIRSTVGGTGGAQGRN